MSKRYIHYVEDETIDDVTKLKALADQNPAAYPLGATYVLQGATKAIMCVVSTNDGTAVTFESLTA